MTWGELSCGAVGRTVAAISGENLLMANLQQERVTSLDVIGVLNVNIKWIFNQAGNFQRYYESKTVGTFRREKIEQVAQQINMGLDFILKGYKFLCLWGREGDGEARVKGMVG
jgi:hypothetical protein